MPGPLGAGLSRRKPPPPGLNPPPLPRRKSRRGGRLLCTSLKDSLPLQQAARGLARLRALLQPFLHFVHVDLDLDRFGHRIVVPEVLDKAAVARRARVRHHEAVKDRKSTRLNSSHSQISYAVFCLQKKTKN